MTTYENKLRLVEEVEFKGIFTDEEFKMYRMIFIKYDENKSNSLEIFELHRMYEDRGETKTNVQLKQLIKDADPQATDAISYKSFLTIIMKDKKGLSKSALGSVFVELLKPVEAKVHKGGLANKSNMFEQKAADQANSYVDEGNSFSFLFNHIEQVLFSLDLLTFFSLNPQSIYIHHQRKRKKTKSC